MSVSGILHRSSTLLNASHTLQQNTSCTCTYVGCRRFYQFCIGQVSCSLRQLCNSKGCVSSDDISGSGATKWLHTVQKLSCQMMAFPRDCAGCWAMVEVLLVLGLTRFTLLNKMKTVFFKCTLQAHMHHVLLATKSPLDLQGVFKESRVYRTRVPYSL